MPLVIESGHTVTFEDRRFDYGEQRFITLGVLRWDVVAIATAETDRSWTGDRHCPCKPRQAMNGPLTPRPSPACGRGERQESLPRLVRY